MPTKPVKTKKTSPKAVKKTQSFTGAKGKKEKKLTSTDGKPETQNKTDSQIKLQNEPQTSTENTAEKLLTEKKSGPISEKYYEAVGRRKEATARVRLFTKKSTDIMPDGDRAIISINDKPYFEYFKTPELYMTADAPLRKLKSINRFKATAKVRGGGAHGQADAIKHGLARSLVMFDQNFAKKLRKSGYLTRDARVKERRKYGLKKARKSPQWAKR